MKTNATRWMTAAVAAAIVVLGFWSNSQAATIAYVGSEISSTTIGASWGTTTTGYKGDYRSTDSTTKAWTLPDKPNAYGTDGYIIFGSGNYSQEAAGTQYRGMLYTGSRSGQAFINPTEHISQISIQGTWSGGNTGVLDRWTILDGGPSMDDPTLGIGPGVTDVAHGSLWWRYDGTNATKDLLLITMGDAPRAGWTSPFALASRPTAATTRSRPPSRSVTSATPPQVSTATPAPTGISSISPTERAAKPFI